MARDTLNARQPGYIRIDDDTALHFSDWGDGAPLVFLSGWTLDADMWNYQRAPLAAAGFRCVAYDRRGHGRSSDPGRGYDYDTLADDLEAVLDARSLARVTLVGHSFASGEIVRYLSRHGSRRVAGIVLVSPASTPYLLKTADNPAGLDASLFEASIAEMCASFPDWIERRAEAYFSPGTSRTAIQWTADMMLRARRSSRQYSYPACRWPPIFAANWPRSTCPLSCCTAIAMPRRRSRSPGLPLLPHSRAQR
ncbi:alpha/beta fold hydrolase [Paraburkholderia mimosarum]|uniref:alpha/beta fold hydrolase n=1 Tax=Paraburkholderia mimosarum TaxID=312026 RepID=UPI000426E841|nr:alpha/beta fold hydrolase [Paraburkholderia mimosarum]